MKEQRLGIRSRITPVVLMAVMGVAGQWAPAAEGRITVPAVSGRAEVHIFSGHPGWVDAYRRGYGTGVSARIDAGGKFTLPPPDRPVCLIAMFDKMETPPVIVPQWPKQPGKYDVAIPAEYACVPAGYPETWDREYMVRATDFWQTFQPKGTHLYGVSVWDGPKIVDWGNKINATLHEGGRRGKLMVITGHGEERWEFTSAGHSDHEMPRVGWRHGDMPVVPGRTYAINVGGYHSHGGQHFKLDAFVRPDRGDGYPHGEALADDSATGGDLCCLIFGNHHGQIVENQIRSEEWEIFIPQHRPTTKWAQTFTAHGVSLAGVVFWAGSAQPGEIVCEVRIRKDGPWGDLLKPVKVAHGHVSPQRPIIRYPDTPRALPEYEAYYKLPCNVFQAAWLPDEMPFIPGKTYCVEIVASRPIMMYADGDYYDGGYAYYEGLKVGQQWHGHATKHSKRWTLAMPIVTYANPGGEPLAGDNAAKPPEN